ncbi:MAG: family 78 glycoside hydrolase catalytic domain [Clostridia bacterium]|nr:family 78 glycoside hydrolase catalytic domain [Clostridia bacterium]
MLFTSKWITYTTGEYKSADDKYGNPAPYFRKTFSLSGELKKATLLASALGIFKIYLNGKAIAEDYLSPGWVDYSKKLPFMRYDVTGLVTENNAVGAVLADGWAVGHVGSNYTFKRNNYSDRIEFTAVIQLEYTDGRVEEIPTDGTWKAAKGEILRSDIYMGEYVDHRLSLGNFSAFDYDDSAWDPAEETVFKFSRNIYLEEVTIPPVVVKHTFTPKLIAQEGNQYIFDVTQNIAGVLRCVFKGSAGSKVTLRHGELFVDGKVYTENLRKAEATDTYILSGEGEEIFRPIFTFHGFQFAEITLEGDVQLLDLTAEAMYTDLRATGEFSCSDEVVTKVYQNALWGQRDNFLNVPTDCPQRDERLGWTGDAQIFCQSAMWNMDCKTFYEKYMADVRDAQLGNGAVPAVAPLPHVGSYDYCGHEVSAGWAEAVGEIPYAHYRMYGDIKIVRDNLFALKRLLDYYETESPDGIRISKGAYGDWLSLGTPTDVSVVSTLYYARAAWLAGELCHLVNDFEEARYKALYEKVKRAFRERFLDAEGRILSDTQSAYVIAYAFGVISLEETRAHLVRKFEETEGKLTTGFLAIKYLLPTLCDIGRSDIAYSVLTRREFPGWGYSVMNGATTIWERWDSYTEKNGIRKGMNSFNHYSFGSCTEWMYEYCLGIRPDIAGAGVKKVTFAPVFDRTGKITHAEGYYDSDFGRIEASWKKCGEHYEYLVTVPHEIERTFVFEGATLSEEKQEVGERCRYRFVLE